MTTEEKTSLILALILVAAMIPFLMMANDTDAMKVCMTEFSHDVCAHTLR